MNPKQSQRAPLISAIEVWGYKSIGTRQHVDLAPLTIFAGTNSSGKSSLMQPLLLLKQTMEVGYDPGVLLLDGSHVRFSSAEQIFSKQSGKTPKNDFGVKIELNNGDYLEIHFGRCNSSPLELKIVTLKRAEHVSSLKTEMSHEEILKEVPSGKSVLDMISRLNKNAQFELTIQRDRFLLRPTIFDKTKPGQWSRFDVGNFTNTPEQTFIRSLIHLPGLRGNPLRSYPVSAIASNFPGTFESYTASMIAKWQTHDSKSKLSDLADDMIKLGLTWKVEAKKINDTQVELLVGRLPKSLRGGSKDLVSIADVGFGVSQTLPVLVALHAAEAGQTVYLEQPEIHLHPKAQLALAEVLASAVRRGVRLIVETHSAILLLGVQTLIAQDKLSTEDVVLHWFGRNSDTGWTNIMSTKLDETGAFGDWPVDFGDVSLAAENAYLTAAEEKLLKAQK